MLLHAGVGCVVPHACKMLLCNVTAQLLYGQLHAAHARAHARTPCNLLLAQLWAPTSAKNAISTQLNLLSYFCTAHLHNRVSGDVSCASSTRGMDDFAQMHA
jgi:hypothetical protein